SEEARKGKEVKSSISTVKYIVLSLGIAIALALIAYTTILYGGKLIADEDKLMIALPTTIETEEGEIIWYLYDQYRLPVDLEQVRSEEHTSELQSRFDLVCRLLLEKKK